MTTPFDRPLYGFRFIDILFGDTLPVIAARELGDAGRWAEIIALNSMIYPYITDDPDKVVPGVFLSGTCITVPASAPSSAQPDPNSVFGTDILLVNGKMTVANGDIVTVSDLPNLEQALGNLITTDQGELIYHTEYGTKIRRLIGDMNGPTAALLAANDAKTAVARDKRISTVNTSTGTVSGDAIIVNVVAEAINGTTAKTSGSF